jgi:hypothetical protein
VCNEQVVLLQSLPLGLVSVLPFVHRLWPLYFLESRTPSRSWVLGGLNSAWHTLGMMAYRQASRGEPARRAVVEDRSQRDGSSPITKSHSELCERVKPTFSWSSRHRTGVDLFQIQRKVRSTCGALAHILSIIATTLKDQNMVIGLFPTQMFSLAMPLAGGPRRRW